MKEKDQSIKKKFFNKKQKIELPYTWNPEQMLEMLLKSPVIREENWIEKDLPKLIDKLIENYEKYGGINHLEGKDLPSKQVIVKILDDLMKVIFPGYLRENGIAKTNTKIFLQNNLKTIYNQLVVEIDKSIKYICRRVKKCPEDICYNRAKVVAKELLEKIPEIRILVSGDIQAAFDGDPAAKSIDEIILGYPCVLAISTYRIAHELYMRGIPLIPRIMGEYAHSITGIDIHPGAKIGKNFFIDHGTGVVIGETTKIGDNVKIYQGVTLGALSFPKDEKGLIIKGRKRHPTIGNNVIIYSGATLLGEKAIIGNNAVIGGNVWLTTSIPSDTQVIIASPELNLKKRNDP